MKFLLRRWLLFFLTFSHVYANSNLENLSQNSYWQKLLHFRGNKSEARPGEFFISPDGHQDAHAEILALQQAIEDHDLKKLCRFPLRVQWLTQQLPDLQTPFSIDQCPELQRFLNDYQFIRADLVFSSYYLDSASSMFGHTFLRLAKNDGFRQGKHFELLDIGVSYGANSTTDNAFSYALLGLTGGFDGSFSSLAYYYKVREYNDFESRDLWSYPLELTSLQKENLLLHLWELNHARFAYYYLRQNCSYQILALLEVTDPQLNLIDSLPFYIIPGDTLKLLYQKEKLSANFHFRASLRDHLYFRYQQLNDSLKKDFLQIQKKLDFSILNQRDENDQVLVLDTLLDYWDFQYGSEILLDEESDKKEEKKKIQLQRAKVLIPSLEVRFAESYKQPPHKAHGSSRLGLSQRLGNTALNASLLEYRFALHDALDPLAGYPLSGIEMGRVRLAYQHESSQLKLDDLMLLSLDVINPWTDLEKKLNYQFQLNHGQLICANNQFCSASQLSFAPGFSLATWDDSLIISFLLSQRLLIAKELSSRGYLYWIGPQMRLLKTTNFFSSEINLASYQQFFSDHQRLYEIHQENRFHLSSQFSLGASFTHSQWANRAELKLYFYF